MHLKLRKITLSGFKSFRDRTVLEMEGGITAIVGPNGCGKSNILDAFRFVLGESSAKVLRGGKMHDILFGGTEKVKGKGIAEVKVLFESEGDPLGIGADEIEIGRRIGSDGISDYFVNSKSVRLKDLHLLLHKMGLGKESFWSFEQGRVDQVINWSPDERRAVFEETAGISLYLSQKREALEKLKETKIALEKLYEREKEATKLLEMLKAQAESTERYIKVKERSHILERELYIARSTELQELIVREERQAEEVRLKKSALEEESKGLDLKLTPLKKGLETFSEEKKTLEESLLHLRHRIEQKRKDRELLYVKIKGLEGAIRDRKERVEREERVQKGLEEEIASLRKMGDGVSLEALKSKLEAVLVLKETKELDFEKRILEEKSYEERHQKAVYAKKIEQDLQSVEKKFTPLQGSLDKKREELETLKLRLEESEKKLSSHQVVLEDYAVEGATLTGRLRSLEEISKKVPGVLKGNQKILEWVKDRESPYFEKGMPLLQRFSVKREVIQKGSALLGPFFDAISIQDESVIPALLESLEGLPYAFYVGKNPELSLSDWLISPNSLAPHPLLIEEDRARLKSDLESLLIHKKAISQEVDQLKQSLMEGKSVLRRLEKELVESEQEQKRLTWELERLKKEYVPCDFVEELKPVSIRQELESLRRDEREYRQQLSTLERQREERQKKLLLKQRDFEEREREKGRLLSEQKDLQQKLVRLPPELQTFDAFIQKDQSVKEADELSLKELKAKFEETLQLEKGFRKRFEETLKELADLRIDEIKSKNALSNLQEKEVHLDAEIMERLGRSLKGLTSTAPLKQLEREWKNIKQELEGFTDISLTALERYRKEVEAADLLRKDILDLDGAREQALLWMDELDRESEKRFLEVFKQVGKAFEETFQKLFKGGEARLKLTLPHDLLTSGIEIEAMPPGKAVKSLQLLSGGEKCLVGIALLFALFTVKKAPLALFDEVDAPLDEANLARFLDLLVPFSNETQVILVSHKRPTMEAANLLLGVTMVERGLSSVIPLNLAQERPKLLQNIY